MGGVVAFHDYDEDNITEEVDELLQPEIRNAPLLLQNEDEDSSDEESHGDDGGETSDEDDSSKRDVQSESSDMSEDAKTMRPRPKRVKFK